MLRVPMTLLLYTERRLLCVHVTCCVDWGGSQSAYLICSCNTVSRRSVFRVSKSAGTEGVRGPYSRCIILFLWFSILHECKSMSREKVRCRHLAYVLHKLQIRAPLMKSVSSI